eukprot:scaffold177490_cov50-Attheya_sp.AAC.1
MVNDINQETKQAINYVALLDCNLKNKQCLSRRAQRVLKIEANLRKTIAHLKKGRENILTNYKRVVHTKMKEADDILGYESSVRTKDKSRVSMIDSLVKQEASMRNTLSEADTYLKLSQESVSTEAECDFYGLNDDALSDHEWETFMDTFKAIVNLAYVVTGKDCILLDLDEDKDKALPNHRNLPRIRRRFRSRSGRCSSCSRGGGDINPNFMANPRGTVSKQFTKFVNDYVAAFIMAQYTAHLENGKPVKVDCTFSS